MTHHLEPIPELHPLSGVIDTEWLADYDESADMYLTIRRARLVFPGYTFRRAACDEWSAAGSSITVYPGYVWDGSSGPVIQGPRTVVASLVHDIVCTTVGVDGPVLPGYFRRHALYRQICLAQGMAPARAWLHWWALVRWNWLHAMLNN